MLLRRLYEDALAQAGWLVGCTRTKTALVVDPNRDVERWLEAARAEGMRITHVTETHIHADFVSGAPELARRAGARLLLSAEGDAAWQYAFADAAGAQLLRAGDRFTVGDVRVDVRHTPGHTPEHLTFLVTDTATGEAPVGAITGDFIFVGDVGRPDLLERAAGEAGTMEVGARRLFASLRRFLAEQPDWLQLWPGHGAGSACGKALGALPSTTLGYERRTNWALSVEEEAEFVRQVLAGQPAPPTYFARMKTVNRAGPPPAPAAFDAPPAVSPDSAPAGGSGGGAGAMLLDLRPTAAFAAGHLEGAVHLPLNRSFATWAGWLVPADRDVVLVADEAMAREAVRTLALIGVDRVVGRIDPPVLQGRPLAAMPTMTPAELAARRGEPALHVIDVRNAAEWEAGHMPGVPNIPLGELPARLAEIPRDGTVVLHCQGGSRSAIAASLLEASGLTGAVNLEGGFGRWMAEGQAVERP